MNCISQRRVKMKNYNYTLDPKLHIRGNGKQNILKLFL